MGYKLKLTNLQNVAPGNTATLKAPAGPGAPTYDQIRFTLSGGMTPAHIESIRGKANGRIFLDEQAGTVVNRRDAYRGIFTSANYVTLDFTEPKSRNGAAEQLLASVPASLLQSLDFEIKIAAGAPANGRIDASANYRPPVNNPYIRKLLNTTQSFSAAGTEASPNIMYLPVGGAGGKIKRVWVRESVNGLVTGAQIRIANNVVHEVTRAQVEDDQKRNGLAPDVGMFVLDFIEDGNLAGMLDTAGAPNVELRLVTSAAGTFGVDYELVDPIGRL
ncbi:major capsid protein P2 [Roseateles chitinivorans]|uniref:major capsid protein P2 n=1 Tax=Roseateles chitinivorans TaxID=2917965 RepID=UPI003D67B5FE